MRRPRHGTTRRTVWSVRVSLRNASPNGCRSGRVGTVILAEPSEGMRQVLHAKVAAGVLANGDVIDLDLERSQAPQGLEVDVIVSLMVVHHLSDIPQALARMRAILADGGHLCIVDLEEEDGSFHSSNFTGHHGLGREELSRDLRAAGFAEPTFEHTFTLHKNGRDYDLFLATAAVA